VSADPRPVCLVTGAVTPYRAEPFRMLAEREGLEVLAFRDPGAPQPGLTVHAVGQAEVARRVGSGAYRAVIAGLGGRRALPGAYAGARRARVPFVLWASIWAHPRTPAHALSYLPTRHLYRHADAVVTYGPHVSAYLARARGRAGGVFEAPQAVSAERFGAPVPEPERLGARRLLRSPEERLAALFVGRLEREKGVEVLLEAWRTGELAVLGTLSLVGDGPLGPAIDAAGANVRRLGLLPPAALPPLYAAADVLVLPSIRTATFSEPWGLVANEAMHQGTPVIASDAVGAAAGGLVRHGRNGLVAPQRDHAALAALMRRMAADPEQRTRLGAAAREDVAAFSFEAWVAGMRRALASVGVSRGA